MLFNTIYKIKLISRFFVYDKSNNNIQSSFLLPFLSSLVASLVIILSYAIMNGFSFKINEVINFFEEPEILIINKNELDENILNNDIIDSIVDVNKIYADRFMFCSMGNKSIFSDVYLLSNFEEFEKECKKFEIYDSYNSYNTNISKCIIGNEISLQLGLKKGDIINLSSILDFKSLQTKNFPQKNFIVENIIKTNMLNYDTRIWIEYSNNLDLINKNFSIKSPLVSSDIAYEDINKIKGLEIRNNLIHSNEILQAIKFEKLFYFIFGLFILVGSSMMLLSFNMLCILNNIRLVGFFQSLGVKKKNISLLFVVNSCLISIASFFCALIIFWIVLFFDKNYQLLDIFFPAEIYFNFQLLIENSMLFKIFILNIGIMFFSTLLPIYKINKIDIIECIKNED
tara:strand:- start:210 stop:1406 length:1197 start_codon:yes stop_codon:yes gene_type:complete